jgi:phospholipid N-methyltransferase
MRKSLRQLFATSVLSSLRNGHHQSDPTYKSALFARSFFSNPKGLGSIWPSSGFLIRRTLKQINWEQTKVVVEFGPGIGNFTTEILRRLMPDATLLAIEVNPVFVRLLQANCSDSKLRLVEGSAADVEKILKTSGFDQADCIISGIPFSLLSEDLRDKIVMSTHSVLNRKGAFLVYQFSRSILPSLRQRFRRVRCEFEPLNILPAWLFHCTK